MRVDDMAPWSAPEQMPVLPAPASVANTTSSDSAGASSRTANGGPFGVLPQAVLLIGLFLIGMIRVRRIVLDPTAHAVLARPG
jgi:hypothetical protein